MELYSFNHLCTDKLSDDGILAFKPKNALHSQNCLSWGKSVEQLKTIFNLDTLDLSHVQFSKEMSTYYSGKLMNQLIHRRNSETKALKHSGSSPNSA
jgi:hypothetical protein